MIAFCFVLVPPPFPCPTNVEFIEYAGEGRTDSVRRVLYYYPRMVNKRQGFVSLSLD